MIDENPQFGGTCLRIGCIPSKALLESSHLLVEARDHMVEHGITASKLTVDLAAMMKRKSKIVDTLTGGINMLLKRNKVTTYVGRGKLQGEGQVSVSTAKRSTAKHIILATGSVPMRLPGIEFDGEYIGDSTAALSYPNVPKTLVVIGGGYIGLELGSVWSRLGSKVIVLEGMDQILPGLDREIARSGAGELLKNRDSNSKPGCGSKVQNAMAAFAKSNAKAPNQFSAIVYLFPLAELPNTKDIGLEVAGVKTDPRGFIEVDDHLQTTAAGVYAIGDCIGGAMLAHKASEEGVACVERIGDRVWPCQLRRDPGSRLHAPGNRHGRQDRRAT